jgi:hypothetical protein
VAPQRRLPRRQGRRGLRRRGRHRAPGSRRRAADGAVRRPQRRPVNGSDVGVHGWIDRSIKRQWAGEGGEDQGGVGWGAAEWSCSGADGSGGARL